MLKSRLVPGSPEEWLVRAKADLALAKAALPPGALYEDLCFHAQQAAEKALKAVYVHYGWKFRYVHDLAELMEGLRANGLNIPEALDDAKMLTVYAHEFRYPGVEEPVSEEDYRQSVSMAEQVVRWAEFHLQTGPQTC